MFYAIISRKINVHLSLCALWQNESLIESQWVGYDYSFNPCDSSIRLLLRNGAWPTQDESRRVGKWLFPLEPRRRKTKKTAKKKNSTWTTEKLPSFLTWSPPPIFLSSLLGEQHNMMKSQKLSSSHYNNVLKWWPMEIFSLIMSILIKKCSQKV